MSCVFYGFIQSYFFTPAVGEVDTAAYYFMGEKFAQLQSIAEPNDMLRHQNHVWVLNSEGKVYPKYVPGYPLLLAIGYFLAGDIGMALVSPICGLLTLIGAYILFQKWTTRFWSNFGALVLVLNPMFLVYTGYPLTHSANLCFITWGMVFLWTWYRSANYRYAAACGLTLGYASIIRPTSTLLLCCILTAIASLLIKNLNRKNAKYSFCLIGCWLLFPLLNLYINYHCFGNPLHTGYALSAEQGAFDILRMFKNLGFAFNSIFTQALGLFFAFGVIGIFLIRDVTERIMIICWAFIPIFAYSAYYYCDHHLGWSFTRFFICLFPVYIGMGCCLLGRISKNATVKYSVAVVITLIILVTQSELAVKRLHSTVTNEQLKGQWRVAQLIKDHVPARSVVITKTHESLRLGSVPGLILYDINSFNPHHIIQQISNFHPGKPLMQQAREKAILEFYNKNISTMNQVKIDMISKALNDGRNVYYVLPKSQIRRELPSLKGFTLTDIKKWDKQLQHYYYDKNRQLKKKTYTETWELCQVTKEEK